jgi:hypothetical protein
MRADALLDEGDIEGSEVWRAIVRAIKELRPERRRGGELSAPRSACNSCENPLGIVENSADQHSKPGSG